MASPEQTQPRSPFMDEPFPQGDYINPEAEGGGGPGCFVYGCVSAIGLGFALVIVIMAGFAGWTSGQRVANTNATATFSAEINDQCARIPADIESGNTVLVERRLDFLGTVAPNTACLTEIIPTATALFLTQQPTPTPPATDTPQPTATQGAESTGEAQADIAITSSGDNGSYDLDALMQQAQEAVRARDYRNAIDLLDVIRAVDSTYDSANVNNMLREALSEEALIQFRTGNLAQGIVLTDRAEEFGFLAEGLDYERYIAGLYLDAVATSGTDYATSIRALQALYSEVPDYRNGEIRQRLYSAYIGYGDAFGFESNWCSAQIQYQNALNILNSGDAVAKRDRAQEACENPTPVQLAGTPGTPSSEPAGPIAPVGQVGG